VITFILRAAEFCKKKENERHVRASMIIKLLEIFSIGGGRVMLLLFYIYIHSLMA
jgi:hypothetical protein